MKIRCLLILVAIETSMLFLGAAESSAQVELSSHSPEQQVALSKLSSPTYPPLARQARISGDVELELRIRQDGSLESAQVVSGHPMLKEAALDSAKKSEFECHECKEALTSYSLTYTFGLTTSEKCCIAAENSVETDQPSRPHAGVVQSQNHVTILAEPTCICDPAAEISKVRSAKCLYLWRCGSRRWPSL
jgi:TonB family protein